MIMPKVSQSKSNALQTVLFVSLLLLSLAVSGVAYSTPEAEFDAAWEKAELGDLIEVDDVSMISEVAYKPADPRLSHLDLGEGVRFVRPVDVGDEMFKTFVSNYTTLLDESILRSKKYENTIVRLSHGAKELDFSNFLHGDKTVLAIIPAGTDGSQTIIDTLGGKARPAELKPNRFGQVSQARRSQYGYRQGVEVNAEPGRRSPSALSINTKLLDDFVKAREELRNFANLYHLEFKELYSFDRQFFLDRGLRNSENLFENFHEGLKVAGHELGHSTAHFDGTAVNQIKLSNGDPELLGFLKRLEELENVGLVPVISRDFNERSMTIEMRNSGLHGSQFSFELRYDYANLSAPETIDYLLGNTNPYGIAFPKKHSQTMRRIVDGWLDSILADLSESKGISFKEAYEELLSRWGRGTNYC